jgi:hypothetical protein
MAHTRAADDFQAIRELNPSSAQGWFSSGWLRLYAGETGLAINISRPRRAWIPVLTHLR